jgi:hypothetical protein
MLDVESVSGFMLENVDGLNCVMLTAPWRLVRLA